MVHQNDRRIICVEHIQIFAAPAYHRMIRLVVQENSRLTLELSRRSTLREGLAGKHLFSCYRKLLLLELGRAHCRLVITVGIGVGATSPVPYTFTLEPPHRSVNTTLCRCLTSSPELIPTVTTVRCKTLGTSILSTHQPDTGEGNYLPQTSGE
jgi:hypothetical protein